MCEEQGAAWSIFCSYQCSDFCWESPPTSMILATMPGQVGQNNHCGPHQVHNPSTRVTSQDCRQLHTLAIVGLPWFVITNLLHVSTMFTSTCHAPIKWVPRLAVPRGVPLAFPCCMHVSPTMKRPTQTHSMCCWCVCDLSYMQ